MTCCTSRGNRSELEPLLEQVPVIPSLPENVEFITGSFVNPQGITLRTFRWGLRERASKYKGIVWLCHGYGSHTIFEWLLPAKPGEPHNQWQGSIPQGLVNAGFLVCTLDQQSHGYSGGARGLRCYYDGGFDDLVLESMACLTEVLIGISSSAFPFRVPVFLFGISMGGATAVRMAMAAPELFRGVVLYAPMLSLEEVKKQAVVGCIRNSHLGSVVDALNYVIPTTPLGKPAKNLIFPKSQEEMDNDPLTYSGDCRVRVAKGFQDVTNWFLEGGLSEMKTPFITFHTVKDTFTDPFGSQKLLEMANVADKTYLKVGLGHDVDADMWHALSSEPGREKVFAQALSWIQERAKP